VTEQLATTLLAAEVVIRRLNEANQQEEVKRAGDPRKTWDQLSAWVEQEVSAAVEANFLWTAQRARRVAGQMAEHFSGDQELLPRTRSRRVDLAGVHRQPARRRLG
jgi:macrodomain Ter protein organizer (MatP/YcbG family)